MRALKILVIVMGLMIVGGLTVLFVVIAGRLSQPHPSATPAPPAANAPLTLPAGARIESMAIGGERLAVAVALPDGTRRIVIIDLATGRQQRVIPLRPAAAP